MAKTSNFKKKEDLLPSQRSKWQEHAQKRLAKTGSGHDAEKYANHVTKSAIKRKLKDQKKPIKGLGK